MELDPFALIESMTIAAYATGCERGYLYIRGEYPEPQHALEQALDEARRARFPRRRRHGRGLPLRRRDPQGRRCLHLRRGDGDLRVDRGQARRAAQQAAVPRRRGPVRQADGREQRRDARQRARHRLALGPRLTPRPARTSRPGPKLFCLSGHVAPPGRLRGAVRDDAARTARARRRGGGRRRAPVRPHRAAPRAASCARTSSTCR